MATARTVRFPRHSSREASLGGSQRIGHPPSGCWSRSSRIVEHRAQRHRHGASLVREPREESACVLHEAVRAGAGEIEHLEGERDVDRLARRTALVGLKAVAEATVVVPVRLQRPHDSVRRGALEEGREQQLVERPCLAVYEVPCGCERRCQAGA